MQDPQGSDGERGRPGKGRPEKKPSGAKGCLLLAEDEPAVREIFLRVLQDAGYEVTAAGDGQAMLEISEGMAEAVDLLVTDINMPGMDGIELARRMREQRPRIKVAYLSAAPRFQLIDDGRISEDDVFIEKPVLFAVLLQHIEKLLLAD